MAHKYGASAVAHGATGKGNDQVRFDLAVKGLDPALKIIAPQRERNISRDEAMDYAAKHGIAVPTTRKSPFSIDENLWGRSIEGGVLEDPDTEPPEEAFAWTKSWKDAPAEPGLIRIGFEAGYPVSRQRREAVARQADRQGGRVRRPARRRPHRPDGEPGGGHQEPRDLRVPGGGGAIAAHQDLERFTTLGLSARTKAQLDTTFAQLTYDGFWFSPLRRAIQAFNDEHDKYVTGEVTLKLHKASLRVVGPDLASSASTTSCSPPTAGRTSSTTAPPRASSTCSASSSRSTAACTGEGLDRQDRRCRRTGPAARGARLLQLAGAGPGAPARGPGRLDGPPRHARPARASSRPRRRAAIHDGLVGLWRDAESGAFVPAGEEDVHMAVEAELTRRLGDVAGFLHTARSRNDQVALDLRLFVRERCADVLGGLVRAARAASPRAPRPIARSSSPPTPTGSAPSR